MVRFFTITRHKKGRYLFMAAVLFLSIGLGMGIRSVVASLTFSGSSITGDGAISILSSTSTGVAIGTTTVATLFSVATSSNIFNITSAGNVGVGTSSPAFTFHVYGSSPFVAVQGTATDTLAGILLKNNIGSLAQFWMGGSGQGFQPDKAVMYVPSLQIFSDGNSGDGYINFYPSAAGGFSGTVPKVSFTPTGLIGVGTVSPSSSIHILTTSSTLRIGNAGSNTSGCIEMGNSDGSAGINYITILNGTITGTTTKPAACR